MNQTQTLLRQLGIHGTYKGYHYLLTTMEIALKDERNLLLYSKMRIAGIGRLVVQGGCQMVAIESTASY